MKMMRRHHRIVAKIEQIERARARVCTNVYTLRMLCTHKIHWKTINLNEQKWTANPQRDKKEQPETHRYIVRIAAFILVSRESNSIWIRLHHQYDIFICARIHSIRINRLICSPLGHLSLVLLDSCFVVVVIDVVVVGFLHLIIALARSGLAHCASHPPQKAKWNARCCCCFISVLFFGVYFYDSTHYIGNEYLYATCVSVCHRLFLFLRCCV